MLDCAVASDFVLDHFRAKCLFEEIEKACGVLHTEVRIELLQDFRPVAFSCGVRGDEPEVPRRVAHARLAVAIIPIRRFVGATSLLLSKPGHRPHPNSSRNDAIRLAWRSILARFRELDNRIANSGLCTPDGSVLVAHQELFAGSKGVPYELKEVICAVYDEIWG
jgi:hypothetical protein